MSTLVSFNGSNYRVPSALETDWASLSDYLIALATGSFQKVGGTFTLTADADFGAAFGLKVAYLKSRTVNVSSAGIIRFANNEGIGWRNAANSADLALLANASDRLTFNSVAIPTISSTDVFTNKSIDADTNVITNIEDADIKAAAAIDATKIANGSVSNAEFQYLDGVTSAIQTQIGTKSPLASPTFTGTVTLPILVGSDTTDSSSSTTGAFKTAGGMGIAKKLFVGAAATLGDSGSNASHLINCSKTSVKSTATTTSVYFQFDAAVVGAGAIGAEGTGAGKLITNASNGDLSILANSTGISFSADNGTTLHARLSSTGALTAGATTGGDLTHIFQSNGNTLFSIRAATQPYIDFRIGGTQKWQHGVANTYGTDSYFFYSATAAAFVGGPSAAGAWTLGASAGTTTKHTIQGGANSDYLAFFKQYHATDPYGLNVNFSAAAPNNSTNTFVHCNDTGGVRFSARSNGGLANYQANNANLSDERTKKDIKPAKSYLDIICQIPVVTFKYKDQTHDDDNLGVIAQQVEAVAPEFVDPDEWGENAADGTPLKSIYTTDLMFGVMKAVQELKAESDLLKARLAAAGL